MHPLLESSSTVLSLRLFICLRTQQSAHEDLSRGSILARRGGWQVQRLAPSFLDETQQRARESSKPRSGIVFLSFICTPGVSAMSTALLRQPPLVHEESCGSPLS